MINEFEKYYEVDERLYLLLKELGNKEFMSRVLNIFTYMDKLNDMSFMDKYYELSDIEAEIMDELLSTTEGRDSYNHIIKTVMFKHLREFFRGYYILIEEDYEDKLYEYEYVLQAFYHMMTTEPNMVDYIKDSIAADEGNVETLLELFSVFGNVNPLEYYLMFEDVADIFFESLIEYLNVEVLEDYSDIIPYLQDVVKISEEYKQTYFFRDIIDKNVDYDNVDSYINKLYYNLGLYQGDANKIAREVAIFVFFMNEYHCKLGYQFIQEDFDVSDIDNIGDIINIKETEDLIVKYIDELCVKLKGHPDD